MIWSPYGGGELFKDSADDSVNRIKKVTSQLGEKYQVGFDQIILSWIIKHPAQMVPVIGSSKTDRIRRALEALNVTLTREEWYEILQASTGKEVA